MLLLLGGQGPRTPGASIRTASRARHNANIERVACGFDARRRRSARGRGGSRARRRPDRPRRDRATDDEVVGTALDRFARRQDAHLIVPVRPGRADAGHHETELLAAHRAHVLHVLTRHDDTVQTRRLRLERERRGAGEILSRLARQHGDRDDQRRRRRRPRPRRGRRPLERPASSPRLRARARSTSRRRAARCWPRRARRCWGCRAACSRRTPARARRCARTASGPRAHEELEPDLQHPDVRARASPPALGVLERPRHRARRRSGRRAAGSRLVRLRGTPGGRRAAARGGPPATRGPSPSGRPRSPCAISTGAAGSTSTAVPTCTADAPARSISTASVGRSDAADGEDRQPRARRARPRRPRGA